MTSFRKPLGNDRSEKQARGTRRIRTFPQVGALASPPIERDMHTRSNAHRTPRSQQRHAHACNRVLPSERARRCIFERARARHPVISLTCVVLHALCSHDLDRLYLVHVVRADDALTGSQDADAGIGPAGRHRSIWLLRPAGLHQGPVDERADAPPRGRVGTRPRRYDRRPRILGTGELSPALPGD